MHLTSVDRLFWALSFLGHCGLLAVLLIRRRTTSLPVFTTLISTNILRTIILYITLRSGSSEHYFYTYWTFAILDTALQLALAYELASHIFQPLGAWAPDVRRSFIILGSASLTIALGLTWFAAPATRTLRLAIVIRGNFFSSLLMTELLVMIIALSVTLGLPWRTHVARVALGFGVYSLNGIITDAAHSYFGSDQGGKTYKLLSHLQIELYLLCLLFWIFTLAQDEPKPLKMPAQLHAELVDLQKRVSLMLSTLRTMGSAS